MRPMKRSASPPPSYGVAEPPRAKAFCTIVAGPNGSGKSTIYPLLSLEGEFVNADIVARRINPAHPESVSMAAGRLVLRTIDEILSDRRSFVYETTLSSRQSLAVMERCKEMGYEVALVYIALDSPELNVQRRGDILDLLEEGYGKSEKGEYERKAPERPIFCPNVPSSARGDLGRKGRRAVIGTRPGRNLPNWKRATCALRRRRPSRPEARNRWMNGGPAEGALPLRAECLQLLPKHPPRAPFSRARRPQPDLHAVATCANGISSKTDTRGLPRGLPSAGDPGSHG